MNKIFIAILFFLLGSNFLIAEDKSPPKVTTQQYDNWTYQCVESGKDKNCEVSQTIRIQNTNINFSVTYTKFLNDKPGTPIKRYGPPTQPLSITKDIEKLLLQHM